MESRVETATLGVGMDLQGHKVVPGNITTHLGTGILDQHHAIWKMPALFFNFKAKGSNFKLTRISWRKDASTEVVVRTVFS